ncbi:hypothetical protein P171DRAFT_436171 [Karstenula rhodostoma CBS 690.94]|uniref:Uncharacterized protein n=1 Tax=Karstenula rhodostoma CBS 690.94 TaxID=1392251 RepID=A0A9P4P9X2_9PLEO|nr:hypothetical protein P171DRAFT_436171 [Karstenula rhodostoma CBS 690.94]
MHKFTLHTIAISISSLTLLALSTALLALESRVQDAFSNNARQYPGSNMAEFIFVPLNPSNIDAWPTVVKFAVGACSLLVSLLGLVWLGLHWWASIVHIRMLGSAVCIATVTNTAATIGFTVYLFTSEAQGRLPKLFRKWGEETFTREFYLCKAVPSIFPDTNAVYGFPACEKARAGRYLMLVICCVSAILAGFSVLQAHQDGVFAVFVKDRSRGGPDVERGRPKATKVDLPQPPETVHMPSEPPLPKYGSLQNVSPRKSQYRTSLYGYYTKS